VTGHQQIGGLLLPDPAVVVLIGAAGAGKSTLAARWRPEQVVGLDTLRAMVANDPCDQGATCDAVRILRLVLGARCRRGLTTGVDSTAATAGARWLLVAQAHRWNLPAVAIVLDTPLAVCQARQRTRPGPPRGVRWGRAVPDEVVAAQHAAIQVAIPGLPGEGFAAVHQLQPAALREVFA
jgi:predicted kinase